MASQKTNVLCAIDQAVNPRHVLVRCRHTLVHHVNFFLFVPFLSPTLRWAYECLQVKNPKAWMVCSPNSPLSVRSIRILFQCTLRLDSSMVASTQRTRRPLRLSLEWACVHFTHFHLPQLNELFDWLGPSWTPRCSPLRMRH